MATYTTLEEIKTVGQSDLFGDEHWKLRPEQREAINDAKERFCKKSGSKPNYQYTILPKYRQFLWNAKMRFGKTLCAMQLMREMDVKRTLIITHRPVVSDSWLEAFKQVIGSKDNDPVIDGNTNLSKKYGFGTRSDNEADNKGNFYELEKFVNNDPTNHYAFFVSMQYIRLSELVNAKTLAKNEAKDDEDLFGHNAAKENEILKADILNTDWDLVIIDEAHEGTQTALGKKVIEDFLKKEHTKMLHLSGTPFNLYEDFQEDEIFTWDYIAEQTAKKNWYIEHPNEKNPYEELPRMNIFTYDITKNINTVIDSEGIFTFSEFFRTWTGNPKADNKKIAEDQKGRFVHEEDVKKFLKLIRTKDEENNFPFAIPEYRKMFKHTLWVVSHVNEAKALETLLHEDPIFGNNHFKIINVAGNRDGDEESENALDAVKKAIGTSPEATSTITISCGRLTTGVTVQPWTAVLYLKGGDRASTYMQTIFRVQSPYKTQDGKLKTNCFVFDFAPDRALKIVAETAKFSSMAKEKEAKKKDKEDDMTQEMRDKQTMQEFISLCPVISLDNGQMTALDVTKIYKQLENVFIDRLVRKGFDDPCLYVQDELNKIDKDIINNIGLHGGQAPDEKRKDAEKSVNLSHMTEEERKAYEEDIRKKIAEARKKAEEKAKKDAEFQKQWDNWTDEEREKYLEDIAKKEAEKELKRQQREEFKKRISNIRGIALRIPLLMYGGADAGDTKEDITVDNFTRKIKDESWAEFMPKGISKEDFNKIKKCFNATRFEEAGKKYRKLTREADFMHVNERIKQISEIFSYFHNPDKETVLTPWRVVNMHMSDCLGGYCFYDETFDEKTGQLDEPRFVSQGEVTEQLFNSVNLAGEVETKFLEINSKTGLYPLYVTYSLYRRRLQEYIKAECIDESAISVQEEQVVWDDIVENNIYVICNTPMAVGITRRTLFGFRDVDKKANIKNERLIERTINDQDSLIKDLNTLGYWKGNTNKRDMKFNAVIGNPPYQEIKATEKSSTNSAFASALYPAFIDLAMALNPNYISLITPSRWMTKQGQGISNEWVDRMIKSNHFVSIHDFPNANDCFENVEIKGGINYFLMKPNYNGKCFFSTHYNNVETTNEDYLDPIGAGIVVRDPNAMSIINKIIAKEGYYFRDNSFSTMVSPKHYFDRNEILSSNWKGYSKTKDKEHCIKYYMNKNLEECGFGWIKESDIPKGHDTIKLNKIYIPMAGGTGNDSQILGIPFYGEPNSVCSYTYLVIGYDKEHHNFSKEECLNIISYMKTKFFRYMVSIKKKTQNTTRDLFQFAPILDFSKPWTDEELYDKYGLDMFEREYIESLIKPMD